MHTVSVKLPRNLEQIRLYTIADTHLGEHGCDLNALKNQIAAIASDPNSYAILNGDIMNNAIKTSVSDTYSETLKPMDQLDFASKLFDPIASKILAVTTGNHESRTYKSDGIDITRLMARQIGIEDRYDPNGVFLFLRLGKSKCGRTDSEGQSRRVCYTIYTTHGTGGGRGAGGKANRLSDMSGIIDADIYIHSHTHLPMVMREAFHRVAVNNDTVQLVDKLFVNTGSSLNYGGYGQAFEYKPVSKETPVILLSGTEKKFTASL